MKNIYINNFVGLGQFNDKPVKICPKCKERFTIKPSQWRKIYCSDKCQRLDKDKEKE